MHQRLYMDIRLYDDNMRIIYNQQKIVAEQGMKETEQIIRRKIRGI